MGARAQAHRGKAQGPRGKGPGLWGQGPRATGQGPGSQGHTDKPQGPRGKDPGSQGQGPRATGQGSRVTGARATGARVIGTSPRALGARTQGHRGKGPGSRGQGSRVMGTRPRALGTRAQGHGGKGPGSQGKAPGCRELGGRRGGNREGTHVQELRQRPPCGVAHVTVVWAVAVNLRAISAEKGTYRLERREEAEVTPACVCPRLPRPRRTGFRMEPGSAPAPNRKGPPGALAGPEPDRAGRRGPVAPGATCVLPARWVCGQPPHGAWVSTQGLSRQRGLWVLGLLQPWVETRTPILPHRGPRCSRCGRWGRRGGEEMHLEFLEPSGSDSESCGCWPGWWKRSALSS